MKLAVRPTGGTAPEAPCRAPCNAPASGGGACRRLSPPKERQRRSRKRHSFLSRTRLRGQIEPWIFFCEIAGEKVTVIRLTLALVDELFIEMHFSWLPGTCSNPRAVCADLRSPSWTGKPHSMEQAYFLLADLRRCGVAVHAWP